MIVKAFRGLRPRADLADRVPSYPYDVVSSDEARKLAEGDPHSFLHVVKPEIDLDPDIDPYDTRVYAQGRENLRCMMDEGWMVRDTRPAYYVYRLVMGDWTQTGIVGAAAVADYQKGRIKRHEHTRPEKVDDRVNLGTALQAHPGPVLLTYRRDSGMNAIVDAVTADPPAVRFRAPDEIEHTLWVVDDPERCAAIEARFAAIPCSYVADGHHRTAAAARLAERQGAPHFLAVHFPSDQLRILDYNRVVRDLNGLEPDTFLERIRQGGFDVAAGHADRRPPRRGTLGMYVAGGWYLLTANPRWTEDPDSVERLDVAILTRRILDPILGIKDLRTDKRIDFVGGIRGMSELESRVNDGSHAAAFALYPTSLDDVMDVADAGLVMPPKSTWFEPKLRSGMVVQLLEGASVNAP